MKKIKECPFCGAEPMLMKREVGQHEHAASTAYVKCGKCGARSKLFSVWGSNIEEIVEKAINAWSKRNCQCNIKKTKKKKKKIEVLPGVSTEIMDKEDD